MQVRATQVGYYGLKRRKVGEQFELEDEAHFSARWMEAVNPEETPKSKAKVDAAKPEKPKVEKAAEPKGEKKA